MMAVLTLVLCLQQHVRRQIARDFSQLKGTQLQQKEAVTELVTEENKFRNDREQTERNKTVKLRRHVSRDPTTTKGLAINI